jgi:universal stress protein A
MKTKSVEKTAPDDGAAVEASHASKGHSTKAPGTPVKLKRLLVPLDFSDGSYRALDYALTLAETFEAKVILLHVIEPAFYPENYLSTLPAVDEANQNLLEAGQERLAEVIRKRIGHRSPVEALVRMGHAHSEIPDTAKALDIDLIILGTHRHPELQQVFLGSTAEKVVRHAACPVLTVRAER